MAGWDDEGEHSSGLFDDGDFTIRNPHFGFDAKYADGKALVLILEGTTDNPDTPEYVGFVSIGKGWVTQDGGKSVVRENNDGKFFADNCVLYMWIDRCRNELQIKDVLQSRGAPTEAAVWKNLIFHVNREPVNFGQGIERRNNTVLLPTRFVGEFGGASNSTAPAGVSAETAAKIAALRGGGSAVATETVRDKVLGVFRGAADAATAQAEALAIPDVVADDTVLMEVMESSEALYAEANA